ncbi:hypothetical protein PISMIDRAFT_327172 [Pisolithus microcarpus 441]|uniref:Unplaced genomic scaffold scaffold_21, whole genome shotgun sequence n=1 Tax=Pisolithus microcarpus 441 TaxID=765257 RepID=A0A0C9ZIT1_9AGAM|nr:hypothetical protein PISMIDRAFT_327172 [Pisolithus microcarpus 441]
MPYSEAASFFAHFVVASVSVDSPESSEYTAECFTPPADYHHRSFPKRLPLRACYHAESSLLLAQPQNNVQCSQFGGRQDPSRYLSCGGQRPFASERILPPCIP